MNNAAKIMLASGMIIAYGYVVELFFAWYSGEEFERYMMWARAFGPYAGFFWLMLICNVDVLQLLWFRSIRLNMTAFWLISLIINVGMWLERYVIVVSALANDYLPSAWNTQTLTWLDYGLLFGSLGTFVALVFLFIRILPAITILLLPEMLGARDLPFPRLSAFGYWSFLIGGVFVCGSIFFDAAPDGG